MKCAYFNLCWKSYRCGSCIQFYNNYHHRKRTSSSFNKFFNSSFESKKWIEAIVLIILKWPPICFVSLCDPLSLSLFIDGGYIEHTCIFTLSINKFLLQIYQVIEESRSYYEHGNQAT